MNTKYKNIPSITTIKQHPIFKEYNYIIPYNILIELIRDSISILRERITKNTLPCESINTEIIIDNIFREVDKLYKGINLQTIINATGTVIHTNLGRAPLSKEAIENIVKVGTNYTNLEFNIGTGSRGRRNDKVEWLIKQLTGAEAAIVVNNNAAAVFLILNSLSKNSEVIISRGELLEIGGNFRIPNIMKESGGLLVEVGTTNRTHSYDYENAITMDTGLIMKVHKSNFTALGFVKDVDYIELSKISKNHNIPFYYDLGSGTIYDFALHNISEEPTIKKIVRNVDIVSFSGDKLIGGPQCGIIVGKEELISRIKNNQLERIVRIDKLNLAALIPTLHNYITSDEERIPVIKTILLDKEVIFNRSVHFLNKLSKKWDCEITTGFSKIGGGSMPSVEIETFIIKLSSKCKPTIEIERELRMHNPPILARVLDNSIAIDLRTVKPDEEKDIIQALNKIGGTV